MGIIELLVVVILILIIVGFFAGRGRW